MPCLRQPSTLKQRLRIRIAKGFLVDSFDLAYALIKSAYGHGRDSCVWRIWNEKLPTSPNSLLDTSARVCCASWRYLDARFQVSSPSTVDVNGCAASPLRGTRRGSGDSNRSQGSS